MPSDKDVLQQARSFLDRPNYTLISYEARQLLRGLADEVERLRKQTPELRQRERKQLSNVIEIRGCDRCELCEDHQ